LRTFFEPRQDKKKVVNREKKKRRTRLPPSSPRRPFRQRTAKLVDKSKGRGSVVACRADYRSLPRGLRCSGKKKKYPKFEMGEKEGRKCPGGNRDYLIIKLSEGPMIKRVELLEQMSPGQKGGGKLKGYPETQRWDGIQLSSVCRHRQST